MYATTVTEKLRSFNYWIRQRVNWSRVRRFSIICVPGVVTVLFQGYIIGPSWKAYLHSPSPRDPNLARFSEKVDVVYSSLSRKLPPTFQIQNANHN